VGIWCSLKVNGVVDPKHGPGLPSVGWPATGLIKDTRKPIVLGDVPERWRVAVQAPQEGESIKFVWAVNQEAGLEVPLDKIYIKILANADLAAAGIVGDLNLLANGAGVFETRLFPQFGLMYDGDGEPTGPVVHTWTIEAGAVPEPGTVVAACSLLVPAAVMFRRRRK